MDGAHFTQNAHFTLFSSLFYDNVCTILMSIRSFFKFFRQNENEGEISSGVYRPPETGAGERVSF